MVPSLWRLLCFWVFLAAGQAPVARGKAAAADLQQLVGVLLHQRVLVETTIGELRADLAELRGAQATLGASATARRHEHTRWRREMSGKLQALTSQRRLATVAPTQLLQQQRRGLSSMPCATPSGPALLVAGGCSCAGGALVAGRNLTAELDALASANDGSAGTTAMPKCWTSSPPQLDIVGVNRGDTTAPQPSAQRIVVSPTADLVFQISQAVDALIVLNVSDPNHPVVLGNVTGVSNMDIPVGLDVSPDGQYVYVSAHDSHSLTVVDVGIPTSPTVVASLTLDTVTTARGVAVSLDGKYAYVTGFHSKSIAVVNVSAGAPVIVGSLADSTFLNGAEGVAVSQDGKYAYVAAFAYSGLTIVDVSSPAAPSLVGSVSNATYLNGAKRVAVSLDGMYAYVTSYYSHSLVVVDVGTDPAQPTVVGLVVDPDILDTALDVAVSNDGNYVFVTAGGPDNLVMVNVTDPTAVAVVATTSGEAVQMDFSNGVGLSHNGEVVYVAGIYPGSLATIKWQNCTKDA